jgi:hypothetical protein
MITKLTPVTPSLLEKVQGWNYQKSRRELAIIRAAVGRKLVLVCHLAKYWDVDEQEILVQFSSKS